MPAKPRNPLFKKTDVTRLVEVVRREGLSNYSIEIRRDGLTLTVGEGVKTDNDSAALTEKALEQLV